MEWGMKVARLAGENERMRDWGAVGQRRREPDPAGLRGWVAAAVRGVCVGRGWGAGTGRKPECLITPCVPMVARPS